MCADGGQYTSASTDFHRPDALFLMSGFLMSGFLMSGFLMSGFLISSRRDPPQRPACCRAQLSRRPMVRLNTGFPGALSGSRQK